MRFCPGLKGAAMIRHIVLHRVKPDASPERVTAWKDAIVALCETSPEVLSFSFGSNIGAGPNHYDTATIMDFQDMDTFRAYVKSDRHMAYVNDHSVHVAASLAAIQHEL